MHLFVQNIKCGGCTRTITHALEKIGAKNISIDIKTGEIVLDFSEDKKTLTQKLASLGYPETDENNSFIQKATSYASCMIGKIS